MATGLLMVSNFRYYSFKDVDLRGRMPFVKAILIMLAFALIFTNPPLMLFLLFSIYAVSGSGHDPAHAAQERRQRERPNLLAHAMHVPMYACASGPIRAAAVCSLRSLAWQGAARVV